MSLAPRQALPPLELSLQQPDGRHRQLLARARVRRWAQAALASPATLTLRVVDAAEGLAMNTQYRGRHYATNVLTFDYEREPVVVADIILCAPVVEQEARDQAVSLEAHYAHLIIHGVLHAQGFDHERVRDARRMEARESQLMVALGFADPYARALRR